VAEAAIQAKMTEVMARPNDDTEVPVRDEDGDNRPVPVPTP
jgi:hypothetical protein